MSDEVESFFKSKKKVATKKLGAQTPDSLGRHLEMAVQEQENTELADDEWKAAAIDRGAVEPSNEADSEWIDVDENPEFNLPGLKDLDVDNGDVDDDESEDNLNGSVKQKAWNFEEAADNAEAANNDAEIAELKKEEEEAESTKAYVPPSLKMMAATSRLSKDVNLTSADEFPSLSAAENIGKAMVDRKKKQTPTSKLSAPIAQPNAWSRRTADSSREVTPQHMHKVSDFIATALRKTKDEEAFEEKPATLSRYVPPHLRK